MAFFTAGAAYEGSFIPFTQRLGAQGPLLLHSGPPKGLAEKHERQWRCLELLGRGGWISLWIIVIFVHCFLWLISAFPWLLTAHQLAAGIGVQEEITWMRPGEGPAGNREGSISWGLLAGGGKGLSLG